MKQLGIIRRIDELGRIVIPKELRKTLSIKDGESLEIFIDKDNIILKKFSFMNKITDFAQDLADAIYGFVKKNIIITDNNRIIAVSGDLKKDYNDKEISNDISNYIHKRENVSLECCKDINIINENTVRCTYVINPVITNGDVIGSVIIIDKEDVVNDVDRGISKIAANFLSKYLEE